jgi:hypothetical protein
VQMPFPNSHRRNNVLINRKQNAPTSSWQASSIPSSRRSPGPTGAHAGHTPPGHATPLSADAWLPKAAPGLAAARAASHAARGACAERVFTSDLRQFYGPTARLGAASFDGALQTRDSTLLS